MKPSVGRIVHYQDHADTRPAIVVTVGVEEQLDLTVFRPGGEMVGLYDVKHDERAKKPGTWRWPERV